MDQDPETAKPEQQQGTALLLAWLSVCKSWLSGNCLGHSPLNPKPLTLNPKGLCPTGVWQDPAGGNAMLWNLNDSAYHYPNHFVIPCIPPVPKGLRISRNPKYRRFRQTVLPEKKGGNKRQHTQHSKQRLAGLGFRD